MKYSIVFLTMISLWLIPMY